jgi:spermidine/putrescine-binding protein
MRALWKIVVLLTAASLLLAACAPQQPAAGGGQKEYVTSSGFVCPLPESDAPVTSKELNLFVWTEYIPSEWKECFEMVYGVTINHDEYSSAEEMYAKLSAGGASYDLVQPTGFIVPLMVRQGLLQKMDKSRLTFMEDINPKYLKQNFDPNNEYTVPYQAGTEAIIYNSEKVANPPQSWADLWNPEYANRMVFLEDSRVVIGIALVVLGYDPNTRDPAQLEEAKVKLQQLVPNIRLFDSDSPKTALIAGDVDLGMTWTGEAFIAQQENPAFVYHYPTEGAFLWQDTWAIPANAPHLDAAYAWMNYTMQPNLFWLMLRDFPYENPNMAALEFARENHPDLYEAYMSSPVTNVPEEVYARAFQIEDVGEATPLYDKIWTEVKGGD